MFFSCKFPNLVAANLLKSELRRDRQAMGSKMVEYMDEFVFRQNDSSSSN